MESLMTDQSDCMACGQPMGPIHTDPLICDLCYKEMAEELSRMDSDSQGDGFK
jgi:hypothetical protein